VIGWNPRFLKSGRHDGDYYSALWIRILEGRVWSGHFTNRKKDGSLYDTEGTIAPIHDQQGNLTGFVSAWHDVTERLRLESELRQAQKMESIGRLAGGVAHDFNNLLTVITGYSSLLDEDLDETDSRRAYVKEIRVAGERAASLTGQLLALSRKQIFRPVFARSQSVHRRDSRNDSAARRRRHCCRDQDGAESGSGLGRPRTRSARILMNLSANARDAMPDGGQLIIHTANSIPSGADAHPESVLLAVTDTGIGIPEENRPHLFDPFFTTKERGRGTGLGLSMVYGIVQQSEGWIDVQSEPGKGTTFNIYLPARAGALEAEAPPEEPKPIPKVAATGTVLVSGGPGRGSPANQNRARIRRFFTCLKRPGGQPAPVDSQLLHGADRPPDHGRHHAGYDR